MTSLINQIKVVREAGYIERFHVHGRTSGYCLAQHQYGVAMLCTLLWPDESYLVIFALFHDIPERFVGDIPSPVINSTPELKTALMECERAVMTKFKFPFEHDLTPEQHRKLKIADRLDLWLWILEEKRRHGATEFDEVRLKLEQAWENDPPEDHILEFINHVKLNGWDRLPGLLGEIA